MTIAFLAKKFLSGLVLPPTGPLLLIVIGLLALRWRPRAGTLLVWVGLLLAVITSTPVLVNPLVKVVEGMNEYRTVEKIGDAGAIVVLGGGRRSFSAEYGAPTPSWITAERLRFAAHVERRLGLPILLTGGGEDREVSEATVMASALMEDYGVHTRWVETRSLDTAENARLSAEILSRHGIRRIVLITHALHMPRATFEFEHAGFEVVAAPTGFMTDDPIGDRWGDYLPSAAAAYKGWYVCHELLGLLAQRVRVQGD